MFKLLYRTFIQDNVSQILSESMGFCRGYDKNILSCFIGSQDSKQNQTQLNYSTRNLCNTYK